MIGWLLNLSNRPEIDRTGRYEIGVDDMREAMLVMGVKIVVFPASENYEDRVKMTLLPPDIARFCDYDFTKSISLAAS
jgi:hypothetical protein